MEREREEAREKMWILNISLQFTVSWIPSNVQCYTCKCGKIWALLRNADDE